MLALCLPTGWGKLWDIHQYAPHTVFQHGFSPAASGRALVTAVLQRLPAATGLTDGPARCWWGIVLVSLAWLAARQAKARTLPLAVLIAGIGTVYLAAFTVGTALTPLPAADQPAWFAHRYLLALIRLPCWWWRSPPTRCPGVWDWL